MISKQWVFFDANSTGTESTELALGANDGAINVQISRITGTAAFSVKFKGLVDKEADVWNEIDAVNMGTFDTNSNITSTGIFMVPCAGCYKIKAVLGSASTAGKLKVYGNVLS